MLNDTGVTRTAPRASSPTPFVVADFNGDGKSDIATHSSPPVMCGTDPYFRGWATTITPQRSTTSGYVTSPPYSVTLPAAPMEVNNSANGRLFTADMDATESRN